MNSAPGFPTVAKILEAHAKELGDDHLAYLNHVSRVLLFYQALAGDCPQSVLVAAAFHDLGIWSDRTFDYLAPSVNLARDYLQSSSSLSLVPEVEAIIVNHHKLRPYRGAFLASVETLRKADLVDVSLGAVRYSLSSKFVRQTKAELPNAGFHRRLLQLTGRQSLRTPLRPLPMVRW